MNAMPTEITETVWNRPWPWSMWLTLVVACLLILAIAALTFTERGRATALHRGLLTALRVTAASLIIWMIAGWSIERFQSDLPELIVVLDKSASMQTQDQTNGGSTGQANPRSRWELANEVLVRQLQPDLFGARPRYRAKLITLAEDPQPVNLTVGGLRPTLQSLQADGQQSRLGDGLRQILQRQSGRPTAAVVLLSDGIVTSGALLDDVATQARRLAIPIYCVATGQQLPQPDLALSDLLADDAVYLGDRVNIQVTVNATDMGNQRVTLQLREMSSGKIVDTTNLVLDKSANTTTAQLSYVPSVAGNSLIKVELTPAANEQNLENNTLEHMIAVRDQTLRILLIQKSPSFEYRFLKNLLERTAEMSSADRRAFEVDVVLQDADATHVSQDSHALRLVPGSREKIAAYDVIILGEFAADLIANSTQQLIVDHVSSTGCGLIFICHPTFAPQELAGYPLAQLLPIEMTPGALASLSFDDQPRRWQPTGLGQSALPLQLEDASARNGLWQTLPGPQWQLNQPELKSAAQVLAVATVANPSGANPSPLLISQFVGAGRVVLQTTDETYRWTSYRGSDAIYQRYWIQMMRWLSRGKLNRQDQSELTVEPRLAKVGQPVLFSVGLSSQAAAGLKADACQVKLERIDGDAITLELPRAQNATNRFKASISNLPAGNYRAALLEPAEPEASQVTFAVVAPPGEQANLRADWSAMQQLSQQTHGKFFTAVESAGLAESLPRGNTVRRGSLPPQPLWNSPWVVAAFVILLTIEWILRRAANML